MEALPARGSAVLNADDPYVHAMRERTAARVISYGLSAGAMVRGENVSCAWPRPTAADISYAGETFHVQTKLLGAHWCGSVLAAVSTAIAVGMPMERVLEAVEAFEPVFGRMSPLDAPNGATFIFDGIKAPLWTISSCLDFLETATARRKILVIGSISDTPKSSFRRSQAVIRQALDVVDKLVFAGPHASAARRARPRDDADRIRAFDTLYEANAYLTDYVGEGDLVVLKGSRAADHLDRILLAQTDDIECWRECDRRRLCEGCRCQHSPFVPTKAAPAGP